MFSFFAWTCITILFATRPFQKLTMHARYRILHIADPHFTNCHFTGSPSHIGREHAHELVEVLKSKGLLRSEFEFLILSGDFTWACGVGGFEAAKVFVDELAPYIRENGIVVIPGNHDIQLGNPLVIGKLSLPTPKEEAEEHFRNFLASIGAHVIAPNFHLSVVKRVQLPGAKKGLVIIGLNSCRVERRDAQGWGYVGIDQIYEVTSRLNDPTDPNCARQDDIVLAVMHHNPLPVWDLGLDDLVRLPEDRKFSFLMDAGSVLGFLSDIGVGAVLHGHTHIRSEKRVEGYGEDKTMSSSTTLVMGAGSIGINPAHLDYPHHFQVIEVEENILFGTLHCEEIISISVDPNFPRTWAGGGSHPKNLFRSWDIGAAERALERHTRASYKTAVNYGISQSWAMLRNKRTRPAQWPVDIAALVERLKSFRPDLESEVIISAVDQLFDNPPSENDICNWKLEQYLARVLR
jgi:3',5'-cyclic AMP phosphodiesterase CpdA